MQVRFLPSAPFIIIEAKNMSKKEKAVKKSPAEILRESLEKDGLMGIKIFD